MLSTRLPNPTRARTIRFDGPGRPLIQVTEFVEDSGGIASAAQIAKAGFLPGSISYALESGAIDKLTRGVYCLPEVFDDEFAAISYRWSKCVLSHGSALYLASLSDRVPAAIDVTVPHGYNPRGLTQEYPDTKIHRLSPELYELGIVKAKSPGGGTVKAYCAERAIADLISQRVSEGADPQLVRVISKGKAPTCLSSHGCATRSASRKSSGCIWRCSHDEK